MNAIAPTPIASANFFRNWLRVTKNTHRTTDQKFLTNLICEYNYRVLDRSVESRAFDALSLYFLLESTSGSHCARCDKRRSENDTYMVLSCTDPIHTALLCKTCGDILTFINHHEHTITESKRLVARTLNQAYDRIFWIWLAFRSILIQDVAHVAVTTAIELELA